MAEFCLDCWNEMNGTHYTPVAGLSGGGPVRGLRGVEAGGGGPPKPSSHRLVPGAVQPPGVLGGLPPGPENVKQSLGHTDRVLFRNFLAMAGLFLQRKAGPICLK